MGVGTATHHNPMAGKQVNTPCDVDIHTQPVLLIYIFVVLEVNLQCLGQSEVTMHSLQITAPFALQSEQIGICIM